MEPLLDRVIIMLPGDILLHYFLIKKSSLNTVMDSLVTDYSPPLPIQVSAAATDLI